MALYQAAISKQEVSPTSVSVSPPVHQRQNVFNSCNLLQNIISPSLFRGAIFTSELLWRGRKWKNTQVKYKLASSKLFLSTVLEEMLPSNALRGGGGALPATSSLLSL